MNDRFSRAFFARDARKYLLTTTIASILASAAGSALAQDADDALVAEVVVTGSRIERSGFDTPSPVTVLGEQELQNANVTNVADQLVKIPAFQGSLRPGSIGTSSTRDPSAAYLNLRGMGSNRTLVLLDGKRHVPSSASGSVDTNLVPFALVQRTEVVTGGASAAYGSDAVAGVVNFIINPNFEGVKATLQGGAAELGDDEKVSATFAAGQNFLDGRLNIAAAVQYFKNDETDPVGKRDWGKGDWKVLSNPAYTPTNGQHRLIASPGVGFSNATNGGMIIANSGPLRGIQFGAGGSVDPFIYGSPVGGSFMVGGTYDTLDRDTRLGPLEMERANIYGRIGYEITDSLKTTFEVTLADSSAHSQVTRSTDVGAGGQIVIRPDNAFLPDSVRQIMLDNSIASFRMGRLNTELGFIEPKTDSRLQRYVLSFDGEIGDTWSWTAYGQLGKNRYHQVYTNNRNQERWALATDAVRASDGSIVCRSTLTDPNNGCIPANVFGDGSLHTTPVAGYVLENPYSTTWTEQQAAGVDFSGELFDNWAGTVSLALGAEWRKEELETIADAESNRGIYRVGNITDMQGSYSVKEAFIETVVPLARDVAGARSLELNAAARATDYSLSGSVETWKVGLTYEPFESLRFRGAVSRDIRAPNMNEFFASGRLNSGGTVIDPADGAQYAPRVRAGGNVNLLPEEADSITYGVVWTPYGALEGLRVSLDRFDIDLQNAIGTFSQQDTVDFCYAGNAALCALIERDASGAITLVNQPFINFGYIKTAGVDLEMAYGFNLGNGKTDVRLLGTWIEEYIESDGGRNVQDNVGSVSQPDWKLSARLTYTSGPFRLYLEDQYIPSLMLDASYTARDIARNRVDGQNVINTSFAYDVATESLKKMEFFLTIENILDEDPPIVPAGGVNYTQTSASLYEVYGRKYMAGVRVEF